MGGEFLAVIVFLAALYWLIRPIISDGLGFLLAFMPLTAGFAGVGFIWLAHFQKWNLDSSVPLSVIWTFILLFFAFMLTVATFTRHIDLESI